MCHWAYLSQAIIAERSLCGMACKAIDSPRMQPEAASLLCGCLSPYRALTCTHTYLFLTLSTSATATLAGSTNECDEQPASQQPYSQHHYLRTYPPSHLPAYPPTCPCCISCPPAHLPTCPPAQLPSYPSYAPAHLSTCSPTYLHTYLPTFSLLKSHF